MMMMVVVRGKPFTDMWWVDGRWRKMMRDDDVVVVVDDEDDDDDNDQVDCDDDCLQIIHILMSSG